MARARSLTLLLLALAAATAPAQIPVPEGTQEAGRVQVWITDRREAITDFTALPVTIAAVALHPVAFAGTLGMFVTMINLMPMAQLDGGHILYAARPRLHRRAALVFWFVVLALGYWWVGWYLWAVLVLVLSRGRLDHPPLLDAYRPFPASRRWLLWVALVLFLLTFAPAPFKP